MYGANAIWTFHDAQDPRSIRSRDGLEWRDGLKLPGSTDMKHARDFFTAFEWWMLVPHRDWLRVDGEPASPPTESDITPPHCAATMGQVYVIYIPAGNGGRTITITHLAGETYHARWYNPRDGSYREMNGGIPINTGQKEEWTLPPTPDDRDDEDWVCHVNIGRI